jgi:hypothetical protein
VWNGFRFSGVTLDTSQRIPTASCSGGRWTTTIVTWFNRYYTDNYTGLKREVIIMHEIGHALGLAHVTNTAGLCSTLVIMDADIDAWYDTCGLTVLRQDDINGANALY